jgi:hypothetical protein
VIVLAFTFGGKLINMIAKIRAILFFPNMGIRQHNGQKKKNKRTYNDLQNVHIKQKTELHEPH